MFGDKKRQRELEARMKDLEARLEEKERAYDFMWEKMEFYKNQATLQQQGNMERENLLAFGIKLQSLDDEDENQPTVDGLVSRYHEMYGTGPSEETMQEKGSLLTMEPDSGE